MAHYFVGDRKHLGSLCRDESELELRSYRFARRRGHGRGRSALYHANSYLKNLIQSIADAKFRRMRRELELGSAWLDRPDEVWMPNAPRDRDTTK